MAERFEDAVAGAGIIGLAHAYHLARKGRRVAVFERSSRAEGASVRNFGMLWPIGQPAGDRRRLALRSRELWLEVLAEAGLWHDRCGSIHLAYREDEASVLEEFARAEAAGDVSCEMLAPREVLARSPTVNPEGLRAGLWSPSECCVDPREVIGKLPAWLAERYGVRFFFGCPVRSYDSPRLLAGTGEWTAERLFVCSGEDLRTLYPEALEPLGLVRTKLQMLRTAPRLGYRLGSLVAGGLTLRHYESFRNCPSLPRLEERIARELPEHVRHGIHVMAAQNGRGELVIGDSHEYGEEVGPFDRVRIDELILDYLRTFLDIGGLEIASRWHGVYVKHPREPWVVLDPAPGATVVTGVGGAGMTLSFGLAERVVERAAAGPPAGKLDLVVFDLAGTTVEDEDSVNRAFREALRAAGLEVSAGAVNAVMGLPKPEALRILVEGSAGRETLRARERDVLSDFEARMLRFYREDPAVREVPGAGDLLRALRARGIRVGFTTGFGREIVRCIFRRLGWDEAIVSASVASDESPRGRPHPDQLLRVMEILGIKDPRRVAKVGDTPADLEEGSRAGCGIVAGVCWGTHSRRDLERHPHTHLVESMDELRRVLGA
jgi:FAD dependent oxidoreductase TIGR03364/phosphonatase-like hydrolase